MFLERQLNCRGSRKTPLFQIQVHLNPLSHSYLLYLLYLFSSATLLPRYYKNFLTTKIANKHYNCPQKLNENCKPGVALAKKTTLSSRCKWNRAIKICPSARSSLFRPLHWIKIEITLLNVVSILVPRNCM